MMRLTSTLRHLSCMAPLLAWLLAPSSGSATGFERVQRQCQADFFCVEGRASDGSVEIWLESLGATPLTVAVAAKTENAEGDRGPVQLTIDAPGWHRLLGFTVPPEADWEVDWDYTYHPAGPPAAHDPAAIYRLPYRPGEAYPILQGYDGSFSHRGSFRFAVDWAMPEGTPVVAARGGIVVGLWEGSEQGGRDPALRGQENFLWIRHDDGTVGQYIHLQKDGVLVELGQRIEAGQVIALSGATGYGTEPHLHFHVSTTSNGPDALVTFPLRFQTESGIVVKPETGRAYRAP